LHVFRVSGLTCASATARSRRPRASPAAGAAQTLAAGAGAAAARRTPLCGGAIKGDEGDAEDVDDDSEGLALLPPGAEADALTWRCLEPQHGGACGACVPPPPTGVAVRLHAPHGGAAAAAAAAAAAPPAAPGCRPRRRSGAKLLRAALCRTAEWQHAATRARAADVLTSAGAAAAAGVVAALRERNRDALTAEGMLALCRLWRYRSDLWAPLPPAAAAAPPAAVPQQPQQLLLAPPPPPQQQQQQQQQQQLAQQLAPLASLLAPAGALAPAAAAAPLALLPAPLGGRGPRLEAISRFVAHALGREQYIFLYNTATPNLFAAGAWEPLAPVSVDIPGARRCCAAAAALRAQLSGDAARLRALASSLTPEQADAPSWRLGAAAPPLAEAALHTVLLFACAHSANISDMLSPLAGIEARHARPLSAPERAHIADSTATNAAARRYAAAATTFLARMQADDGACYLAAQVALLDSVAALLHGVYVGDAARVDRARERQCSWSSSFWEHAAALGAPALAEDGA
jgi:hypothetical protein